MAAAAARIGAQYAPQIVSTVGPQILDSLKNIDWSKIINQDTVNSLIKGLTTKKAKGDDDDYTQSLLTDFKLSLLTCHWLVEFFENQNAIHHECLKQSDGSNFMHFMHFLELFQYYKIDKKPIVCKFCAAISQGPAAVQRLKDEYSLYIYQNKKRLKQMLNVFYQCDLILVDQLFDTIKPPCYPHEGTYAWDLNYFLLDRFKKMNARIKFEKKSQYEVEYHGVVYKEDSDFSIFLRMRKVFERYIENNVPRAAFLYSTGSIKSPEHWCGIFIDFNCRLIFFYNSLAKESQLDTRFLECLNAICKNATRERDSIASATRELLGTKMQNRPFSLVTNKHRLQGDSKLCGLFVYDFFTEMVSRPPDILKEFFIESTKTDIPIDAVLEQKMKKFLYIIYSRDLNLFSKDYVASSLESR